MGIAGRILLERARELYPDATPRIITDNGPQFIARDVKEFIRVAGMTHVRTSPYHPESNGKLERFSKTIKDEAIRPGSPSSVEDARRVVEAFVTHYNGVRLHSAIGYVTPDDFLAGKAAGICAERDRRLEAARERRRQSREQAPEAPGVTHALPGPRAPRPTSPWRAPGKSATLKTSGLHSSPVPFPQPPTVPFTVNQYMIRFTS